MTVLNSTRETVVNSTVKLSRASLACHLRLCQDSFELDNRDSFELDKIDSFASRPCTHVVGNSMSSAVLPREFVMSSAVMPRQFSKFEGLVQDSFASLHVVQVACHLQLCQDSLACHLQLYQASLTCHLHSFQEPSHRWLTASSIPGLLRE